MNIVCSSPHIVPTVLGTTDTAAGQQGYLCTDCGIAYVHLVKTGTLSPGQIPTQVEVTATLLALQIGRVLPL